MADINAGSVSVGVVPDASKFAALLRAQLLPAADQLGRDIGKSISERVKEQLDDTIGDGLKTSGEKAKPDADKQGDQAGGAFADAFRRRVDAALKALPKVELDANADEADRKLAELRGQLDELSGKRVGVDISADEALAQLAQIRAALDDVGRGARSDVRVDTAAASAELGAVQEQVDRLDGRTATIKVAADVEGALGNLGMVGAAIAGLGVATPVVATLGAGLGVFAGALGAAGAGLGGIAAVAIPSLSGIKTVLQAQQQATDQASKSTSNLAVAQTQAAERALQMQGAQASLVQAESNAAFEHTQALAQVRGAEEQLTNAEFSARQAQVALTQARKDAAQQLQDLSFQVSDALLSQRQDTLSLEQAEINLRNTQANRGATQLQRDAAQLQFDQAKQALTEQGVQVQRLQAQKVSADKAGVEGSQQVITAQHQVVQTNQQVQDTTVALSKARSDVARTDAQSAAAIAAAQRQIQEIQLQSAAAAQQAAAQQATGADKVRAAMAKLSPAARDTLVAWQALTTEFKAWSRSLDPAVMPLFTHAIQEAGVLLPRFTPIVREASGALGTLETKAFAALGGPFWTTFGQDVTKETRPAMVGLGVAAGNVATGLAGVIDAFLPFVPSLMSGLDKVTGRFATWGKGFGTSSDFHHFMDYVHANGPQITQTFKTLVGLGKDLAADFISVGPSELHTFTTLAQVLDDIVRDNPGFAKFLIEWGAFATITAKVAAPLATIAKVMPIITGAKAAAGGAAAGGVATGGLAGALGLTGTLGLGVLGIFEANKFASPYAGTQKDSLGKFLSDTWVGLKPPDAVVQLFTKTIPGWLSYRAPANSWFGRLWPDFQRDGVAPLERWIAGFGRDWGGLKPPAILTTFFTQTIPSWFTPASTNSWFGQIWPSFERNVTDPIGRFFTGTFVSWFTPASTNSWFGSIWPSFERDVTDPVGNWVTVSLPNWFTVTVPHLWSSGYGWFIADVGSPVGSWFTNSLPNFFVQTVPHLWSSGYGWFMVHIGSPVASWFSVSLPGYFTSAVPHLGSIAISAGVQLFAGLEQGVEQRSAGVLGWFVHVGDAFVHAVDHYFGIKSPSALMAEKGGFLIQGLVLGMLREHPDQIMQTVFGSAPDALLHIFESVTGGGAAHALLGMFGGLTHLTTSVAGKLGSGILGDVEHLGGDVLGVLGHLFGGGSGGGGNVQRWAGDVALVLAQLHAPASALGAVLQRINFESGGNPSAINLTDSNARAGHPSQGLMQAIPSTFATYAGPYRGLGITNPLASIYAGVNYAMHRYPDWIQVMTQPHGYDVGGWLPPGLSLTYNGLGSPEPILTGQQWSTMQALADQAARSGGSSRPAGGQFTGKLILDSGEFLGIVRGEIDEAHGELAQALRAGRSL